MGSTRTERSSGVTMKGARVVTMLALGLSCAFLGAGCSDEAAQAPQKKVLILGFDGMDPQILKGLVAGGQAPSLCTPDEDR